MNRIIDAIDKENNKKKNNRIIQGIETDRTSQKTQQPSRSTAEMRGSTGNSRRTLTEYRLDADRAKAKSNALTATEQYKQMLLRDPIAAGAMFTYNKQQSAAQKASRDYNTLMTEYYELENKAQRSKLDADSAASELYRTAQAAGDDRDILRQVRVGQWGDTTSSTDRAYLDYLKRMQAQDEAYLQGKYGTDDYRVIDSQTRLREDEAAQALGDMGYNYDRMSDYERRQQQAQQREITKATNEALAMDAPVSANLSTVFLSPLQGVDYGKKLAQNFANAYRGSDDWRPMNTDDMTVTNYVQDIRGATGDYIEESTRWTIGGQNVARFLYDTGMSIGDSTVAIAALGPAASVLLGGSAAATTTKTVLDNGGTADQAILSGAAAGLAESFFEKFSVERLLSIKDVNSLKSLLTSVGKQMLTEGSEEGATEIANILANAIIMGDSSDFNVAVDYYKSTGMTEEEAKKQALMDNIGQVAWAVAGGVISGGVMGGVSSSAQLHGNVQAAKAQYGADPMALVEETLANDPGNEYAAKVKAELEKEGGRATGLQLSTLARQNTDAVIGQDKNTIAQGAAARLTELGEQGDTAYLGKVIAKAAAGEQLSPRERYNLWGNERAEQVMRELMPIAIRAGANESEWSQRLGTKRINADVYGQMVRADEAAQQSVQRMTAEVQEQATVNPNEMGSAAAVIEQMQREDEALTDDDYAMMDLFEDIPQMDDTAKLAAIAGQKASGISAQEYTSGAREAYQYGLEGRSIRSMDFGESTRKLSRAQAQMFHEMGSKAAGKTVAEQQTAREQYRKDMKTAEGRKGKVNFEGNTRSLTKRQKESMKTMNVLADTMGVTFHVFESYKKDDGERYWVDPVTGKETKAPNGMYRPETGEIYIDLHAGADGSGLMLYTVSHELTHFIAQWSPAKFRVLAEFLMEEFSTVRDGRVQDIDVMIQLQIDKAKRAGRDISRKEAYEEMVADAMEAMLVDTDVVAKLTKLKARDESLWNKIKSFITRLAKRVRAAYEGLEPDSAEGRFVQQMVDDISRLEDAFAEALYDASGNYVGAVNTMALSGSTDGAVVRNEFTEVLAESKEMSSVRTEKEAMPKQTINLSTGVGTIRDTIDNLKPTEIAGIGGKTVSAFTGRQVRENAMKKNGYTTKQIRNVNRFMDEMAKFMEYAGVTYRFIGLEDVEKAQLHYRYNPDGTINSIVLSAMVKNGDYPVNFDLSSICKKRVAMSKLVDKLAQRGSLDSGKVELTPKNIFEINKVLKEAGYETACLGCFVESKRYNMLKWADTFCKKWNAEVKKVNPNATYFDYGNNNFTEADFTIAQAIKLDEAAKAYVEKTQVERIGRAMEKFRKKAEKGEPLLKTFSNAAKKRLAVSEAFSALEKENYLNLAETNLAAFTMADIERLVLTGVLPGANLTNKVAVTELVKSGEAYQHLLRPSDLLTDRGISKLEALPNFHGVLYGHYGSGTPKLMQGFTPYNSEIALLPDNKNNDQTLAEYLHSIAGARMQSFSDFQVQNIYDYLQIVADLAARKLPAHAYTKEISFAKLMGMTGIKVNLSVMFDIDTRYDKDHAGLVLLDPSVHDGEYARVVWEDEQGQWVYNIGDYHTQQAYLKLHPEPEYERRFLQSIGFSDAVRLQTSPGYTANCGIIGVGYSDIGIFAMLDDNRIRYIIPYHASSLPADIKVATNIEHINREYTWCQNNMKITEILGRNGNKVDWSIKSAYKRLKNAQAVIDELNEKVRDEGWVVKTKKAQEGHGSYQLYENLMETNDPRQTAANFIEWCISNNTLPLFFQFASHNNYYKMLYDFNVYDCVTEEYAPQGEVTNTYPTEVGGEVVPGNVTDGNFNSKYFRDTVEKQMKFMDEYNQNLDDDLTTLAENMEQGRYDLKRSERGKADADYMAAVERGDMATAQRMVDAAAKKAGYNSPKLYHGTTAFGFTKVDVSYSDDKMSFFATDSLPTAGTYSGQDNVRKISDMETEDNIEALVDAYNEKVYEFVDLVNRTAGVYNFLPYDRNGFDDFRVELEEGISDFDEIHDRLTDHIDEIVRHLYDNALYYNAELMPEAFYESEEIDKIYEASGDLFHILKGIETRNEAGLGNYQLYAKLDGMLNVNARGKNWNRIPFKHLRNSEGSTRDIASYAKVNGYSGVIIDNVFDDGGRNVRYQEEPSTVYIFFDPQTQVKSADPVTYDDSGNVIPLSKRFNPENEDIRYSERTPNKTLAEMDDTALYIKNTKNADYIGMILNGTKTEETRSRRTLDAFIGKDFYVTDGKYVYGTIVLGEPHKYTEAEFHKRENQRKHRVPRGDEYDIKPSGIKWAYPIESYEKFDKPKKLSDSTEYKNSFQARQVLYSERGGEVTNRQMLANAFEGIAKNDAERQKMQEYQQKVATMDELERHLQELNSEIRNIKRGKSDRPHSDLEALQTEAEKTANRIDITDRQLLRLEAAAPLQAVLTREREKATRKAKEQGKAAVKRVRDSAAMAEEKRKIRRKIAALRKLFDRGNKDKNVKDGLRETVDAALRAADVLFTEHLSAEEMIRNGITTTLTEREQAHVQKAETYLKQRDALVGDNYDKAKWDEADRKLRGQLGQLGEVFERQRMEMSQTKVRKVLQDLMDAYAKTKDSTEEYISGAYDPDLYDELAVIREWFDDGTTVRDMTLEQLQELNKAYTMVLTAVRNANKLFAKNAKGTLREIATKVMDELGNQKAKGDQAKALQSVRKFAWDNLKPIYAFMRIGSDTLTGLYENIRKGEDVWAVDMNHARKYRRRMARQYGAKKWDMERTFTFHSAEGTEFQLDLSQLMSIYAYSRREQALEHLRVGGIVIDAEAVTKRKNKAGITVEYLKDDATAYNITDTVLMEMVKTLRSVDPNILLYVEEMQDYLSKTMGNKGNEVSMKLYGVKQFEEENYFPLRSASQYLASARDQKGAQVKLKSSGFTKNLVPNANNPVVLGGFDAVWADHVNDMSMYHAFTLPLEDFYRVYNFKTQNTDDSDLQSIDAMLQNIHGSGATAYIDRLLKDINADVVSDNRENLGKSLVSKFKKAAVFTSLSVVVQQYSAVGRAFALIDPKYFGNIKGITDRQSTLREMRKYAPVTIIKQMGYFDTNMGMSAREFLLEEDYEGFLENAKAMATDSQYRDEMLGRLPAMADEQVWGTIWEAVKREVAAKNPTMTPNSEEHLIASGERFTEVITKTQVYDSVFSRSANMRSKSLFMGMITSFMAEPTTSINMMEEAIREFKAGDKRSASKMAGAVVTSVVLNSLLASIVYALRDDDEDETFLEKYISSVATEIVDGLNPMTYVPILRDIWSYAQGYDIERADMSLIADFIDNLNYVQTVLSKDTSDMSEEELAEYDKERVEAILRLLETTAAFGGLSIKNVRRDWKMIGNAINMARSDNDTTMSTFTEALVEGAVDAMPQLLRPDGKTKKEELLSAYLQGDKEKQKRLNASYDSEEKALSALKSAAGSAFKDGKLSKKAALKLLKENIGMTDSEAQEAILQWQCKVDTGIDYNNLKEAYLEGDITAGEAVNYRTKYGGYDREDAQKTVTKWQCLKDTGVAYDDIDDAFYRGKITAAEAKRMYMKYGGYEEDEALDKVAVLEFVKKYPECEGISVAAVSDYYEHCEGTGVDPVDYYDVWSCYNSVEGNRQKPTWAFIDSLPISIAEKDALHCAFWAKSTLHNAPWH